MTHVQKYECFRVNIYYLYISIVIHKTNRDHFLMHFIDL